MTGTSLDGVDAALVEVRGSGKNSRATVVTGASRPLGPEVDALRALATGAALDARAIRTAARQLGESCAAVVADLPDAAPLDLIVAHGQTILHDPPLSWQLFDAAPLARATRTPVVFDLRAADLAMGGQGAPITPLADAVLFGADDPDETRAIINLGGFCNVTILRGRTVEAAADVCACNHLLDGLARRVLDQPFDTDGAVAAAGTPAPGLVDDIAHALCAQACAGRSLGQGDELVAEVESWARAGARADVLASAVAALANVIAARVGMDLTPTNGDPPEANVAPTRAKTILAKVNAVPALAATAPALAAVAGGGVKNSAAMAALSAASRTPVRTTADLGVDPAYREAAGLAVLGALCADRVSITLPHVTGRAAERTPLIAGVWMLP